ncbi:MAG: ABC transporter ATP-binding protein [Patescibacteria group bacterium]|nr:ABC transporter ATP-binding protein [Patescibacteria group bacterium]
MIEVEHLTKYYGAKKAVDDISFRVEKGEILGFLGPNAAGKTTTMRIITCFLSASQGTVRVNGFDIFNNPIDVKRSIGYLPENPPLYVEMAVKDYLHFAGKIRNVPVNVLSSKVNEVMERCAISHVQHRVIGKLSKGYRQRVGLAQALIHDPQVLILDEPTNGLDPKQIIEVRELIKSLAGNHTVILSTHILPEVSMTCGRVVIINEGKLVAIDTPQKLTSGIKNAETLLLEIDGPVSEVLSALRSVQGVLSVKEIKEVSNRRQYQIESNPDSSVRKELVRQIVGHDWGLYELRTVEMSLEQIFLHLTTKEEEVN